MAAYIDNQLKNKQVFSKPNQNSAWAALLGAGYGSLLRGGRGATKPEVHQH